MLLALDTSTAQIGLALYDGKQVLAESHWRGRLRHTRILAPAIETMLASVGEDTAALSALAVALGPGSFTSLRVGLSLAKGLALARGLPLFGVPTLDILAASCHRDETRRLLAVLQAGRGRLAWIDYRLRDGGWQPQADMPHSAFLDDLLAGLDAPVILCGELTADERARAEKHPLVQLPSPARCVRRPAILAELAWQRWQAGQADDPSSLAPIYLHVAGTPPA